MVLVISIGLTQGRYLGALRSVMALLLCREGLKKHLSNFQGPFHAQSGAYLGLLRHGAGLEVTKKFVLSPELIEAARERALVADELPPEVYREFLLRWQAQDGLAREIRELRTTSLHPSGWVLTHLVPLLAQSFLQKLRIKNDEASIVIADRLEMVISNSQNNFPYAIQNLLLPLPTGTGSKKAGDYQISLLRIMDFGIIGLDLLASIYAKSMGLLDTSTILFSDGGMTLHEVMEATPRLGGKVNGVSSATDVSNLSWWMPKEYLTKINLHSFGIE